MPSTQQQVIDYLRTNQYSTGVEIGTGLAHIGKTQSAIDSALKVLRAKGFCYKASFSENAWRYDLTISCEKNNFSSVVVYKTVTVSNKTVLAEGMALGRRPSGYLPYAPGAWEPARGGADDHKRHLSLSGVRA